MGELKNEQSRLILEFDESKRERAALVEKAVSCVPAFYSRSDMVGVLTYGSEQYKPRDQPTTNQAYGSTITSGPVTRTYQAIHL